MGRKAKFTEGVVVKKQPGRKSKKQKNPIFPKKITDNETAGKKLSRHQKVRASKRLQQNLKRQSKQKESNKKKVVKSDSGEEQEESDVCSEDNVTVKKVIARKKNVGFTDDNKVCLKPKQQKNKNVEKKKSEEEINSNESFEEEDGSGNDSNEEEKVQVKEDKVDCLKVGNLNDLSDEEAENDGGVRPIEKQNRLKLKQAEDQKLVEEEMQLDIVNQEWFHFPSDELEKELDSLQAIYERIHEVKVVLGNFDKFGDKNHSRSEHLELFKSDLCTYYNYDYYILEKHMQVMELNELLEFMESHILDIDRDLYEQDSYLNYNEDPCVDYEDPYLDDEDPYSYDKDPFLYSI